MRPRLHLAELPLVPAEIAGLVLVVLAALILAGGTATLSGAGAATGRWILAAGLLLLLGAALATVLIGSPRPNGGPLPPAEGWVYPEAVIGPRPAAEEPQAHLPVGPAVEAGADPADRPMPRPVSTSIPGAYRAAVEALDGAVPPAGWSDPGPPIVAALPFAALSTPPEPRAFPGEGADSSAVLEVELARLRARLREIETSPGPSVPARLELSGGTRTPLAEAAALDTPRLGPNGLAASRACADCGTAVATTGAPSLCSSCGRLLCPSCADRAGGTAGSLYCPSCARSRSAGGGASISGGRTSRPTESNVGGSENGSTRRGPR